MKALNSEDVRNIWLLDKDGQQKLAYEAANEIVRLRHEVRRLQANVDSNAAIAAAWANIP